MSHAQVNFVLTFTSYFEQGVRYFALFQLGELLLFISALYKQRVITSNSILFGAHWIAIGINHLKSETTAAIAELS